MPDNENRDGLRIGGWVPPYRDSEPEAHEPQTRRTKGRKKPAFMRNWGAARAGSATTPRRQPAATGPGGGEPLWTPPVPLDVEEPADGDPTRRSRLVLAAAAGVVVAVIVSFTLVGMGEAPPPQSTDADTPFVPPPLPVPSPAVSILPKPSSSPTPSRTPSRPKPSKTKTKAPVKTAVPDGVLVAGSTIGLEMDGFEGFRVRHDDSDVEMDRIDADSDTGEKADASFRVRKGLGSSSCLSFESVNAPGHFLRHRDYTLRLDERDGSDLFDQDATFCPEKDGDGVVLRSVNYPDHALAVRRGEIRLDDDRATTFEVRPPL